MITIITINATPANALSALPPSAAITAMKRAARRPITKYMAPITLAADQISTLRNTIVHLR
jgi:hypothetical protein